MDELSQVRALNAGPHLPEPAAEAAALARLDAAIDRAARGRRGHVPTRRRLRRRRALGGASIAVGALGLATALVLTDVIGLTGWRGGASTAAADALHKAAIDTLQLSDPAVGPGQYLEVSTDAVYSATTDEGSYLATQNGQLYIPADRSDDWVWVRDPATVARTFGPASERAARQDAGGGTTEIVRAPEGAFYNGPPQDDGFDALPRDPTRLLNHIYRVTLGAGVSRDGEALVFIADALRTGVVPADLRAAMYRAAAMIPGVEITEREANLDGRTGIAIGRTESNGIRQELIIDPQNGRLIGEREVVTRADVIPGFPAGTPMGFTAVTATVVDSAPAGGTLCGADMVPTGGSGSGECTSSR
ncbi:CU044_5270 family protein [uncultured Amnibacterium sp.]|uniref:CU044_5270 family protein n=1 Tax=uncultured Amnibacterium sp. TaxID=1631851 RepID=UPI0035C9ACAB